MIIASKLLGEILINKCTRINGVENHYLINTTVVAISGKNHQWILRWVNENMLRSRVFKSFQSIPLKILTMNEEIGTNQASDKLESKLTSTVTVQSNLRGLLM